QPCRVDCSLVAVRLDLWARMMKRDLDAGEAEDGEAIPGVSIGCVMYKDRKAAGFELGRIARGKKRDLLARDGERKVQPDLERQWARPRAHRDHQPIGAIGGSARANRHACAIRRDSHRRLVLADSRTMAASLGGECGHTAIRVQDTGIRLVYADDAVG